MAGEELHGAEIVARALTAPLRIIAENAGLNGAVVVERVKQEPDFVRGYDAEANQYVNLVEAGIVDTTKVTRAGLQNAASIAEMVLTTEAIVAEKPAAGIPVTAAMPGSFDY